MPGVPSGRGCDACRKQKKRCHPIGLTCQRCQRLGIACDGLGQMRYLFKDQTGKFNTSRGRSRSSNIIATEAPILVAPRFGRTLVSDTTRLQSALVTNISTAISIKFSLLFNFGAFLLEIPRRLGCNEALDAASKCLIAAYEPYCAGQREATYTSLLEYNRALVTLRRCLADPSTARTSETICSVMLLMMAQLLLDKDPNLGPSHSAGFAQILKCRGLYGPQTDFEKRLFLTARGPVVVSAITAIDVNFSPRQWEEIVESDLDDGTLEGATMSCLAKIPDLIRRGRHAKAYHNLDLDSLGLVKCDLQSLDVKFAAVLEALRQRLHTRAVTPTSQIIARIFGPEAVHSIYLRMYSLGIATEILIVSLLVELDSTLGFLTERLERASHEMIDLADEATQWLPLGAMSMVPCIEIAWSGAQQACTRDALFARWMSYAGVLGYTLTSSQGTQYLKQVQSRMTLRSV